jgi:hypothetical protein
MSRSRPIAVALFFLGLGTLGPLACGRREEPAPSQGTNTTAASALGSASSGAIAALQSAAALASSPLNDPPQNPGSLATVLAAASAPPSASAAPSGSASAAPSGSASALASPPGPLGTRLIGGWVFSRFDLADEATAQKWNAIPPTLQQDILAEAPKASIEFTAQKLVTRLAGVPDKTTSWATESESEGALVIKTGDEGRKKITFPGADTVRIEELDKKGAFVTLFARRKPGAAPMGSASSAK